MKQTKLIVLACAIALAAGCAKNKSEKQAAANWQSQGSTSAAASAVAPDTLSGTWQLVAPRQNQQSAKISATEGAHVTIEAGENLSGEYVVQGSYLLILTRDERLRPTAWRINSPDSLTCVRSPNLGDGGADYTGVTLLRAASTVTAEAPADEDSSVADIEEEMSELVE